ncbi:class I SAM-dependent methyltransferase [Flavobacterium branchiophilum]|uniref:Methyltransferase family protein n=1 Tax=Flavobacterium branchiophilum TaxID=55197 RepID=A0A2H3KKH0_9FLAO|nr:class I SAM-dependent methyltransferase [Flavobacterium branchiophilum]PDS23140.1 hypothetical protein B0A77_11535 [Flavobacterium branchiophilum]
MENILSPLTKNSEAVFERRIKTKQLISDYYKSFNIDVSDYFTNLDYISIYKCINTGYRFYYPFNLSGDSKFYEHFQKFDWYYMPWKWEHEISKNYINDGDKLLEVGCGQGAFLKKINELYSLDKSIGLELNESSKNDYGKFQVLNERIEDYSVNNKDSFDVVCSYQVLEHIADVNSFIASKIACLKPKGKMIISVPNNDSYLKNDDFNLNMPPHHMGLWTENSLKNLCNIFPLKLIKVHLEELQEYHIHTYLGSEYNLKYKNKLIQSIVRKFHVLVGVYSKKAEKIKSNRLNIIGHTILLVYEKK